jgi:hypothetical protein
MRDLLSLDPKIHGLGTDTKEARGLANGHGVLRLPATEELGDVSRYVD